MECAGGWKGTENALSMAACKPNELFSFGPSGGGQRRVVSTTGDTGGSSLIAPGERGCRAIKEKGSGEVEFPGVGSCERSSAIWDVVSAMGAAAGCDF